MTSSHPPCLRVQIRSRIFPTWHHLGGWWSQLCKTRWQEPPPLSVQPRGGGVSRWPESQRWRSRSDGCTQTIQTFPSSRGAPTATPNQAAWVLVARVAQNHRLLRGSPAFPELPRRTTSPMRQASTALEESPLVGRRERDPSGRYL